MLCETFWNSINYENLELQLRSKINFFDIGCGSGHHGELYKNLSKESFDSYTGLDIYKHDQFPSKFTHIVDKAENISQHLNKKINFITSQSSLEHVEKDTLVIDNYLSNSTAFCENSYFKKGEQVFNIPPAHQKITIKKYIYSRDPSISLIIEMINENVTDIYFWTNKDIEDPVIKQTIMSFVSNLT